MEDDFLLDLNEDQKAAVLYNDGPSLVIAGAGSGKTRVLTYKIAYLLKTGYSPYHILALTFTNKAAREMRSRISDLLGEESIVRSLWMGTFHSVFSRILRREADAVGFGRDFTIYDNQDSKNLVKSIVKALQLDDKVYKPSLIYNQISKAKNALITPEMYASDKELMEDDFRSNRPSLKDIYQIYCNRCRSSNAMDFDDLLLYTYSLFKEHADILAHYRNQFRYILVDEYQDTNSAQHEIVKLLASEGQRICVVGDDAQSIYSFRGADIGNILHFRNTYGNCKLFKLERNYRSTRNIVDAANSLIAKNKDRIEKTVFSDKQEGSRISVINSYTDMEEGFLVAGKIEEMVRTDDYRYGDFAVLYRTNAQSRVLEESLRKRNIPYKIYGGLSFYQRKEVKDAVSYFRLITNPDDEESFKRVINYPSRGIGDTTLNKILSAAMSAGVSAWQVLRDPLGYHLQVNGGTQKKLVSFKELIEGFINDSSRLNAYDLGERVIREVGIVSDLYEDKSPEGQSRIQNIEELAGSLQEFVSLRQEEGVEGIGLADFLSEISLLTDQDTGKQDGAADYVTMMTVHAAKGLEFNNVLIVGMEENLFPSLRSSNLEKELEEERRLFYVAITRAKENCILSYSKSRFRNGQSVLSSPSRFIKEIDEKYLQLPLEMSLGAGVPSLSGKHFGETPSVTDGVSRRTTRTRKFSSLGQRKAEEPEAKEMHQTLNGLTVGDKIRHERFGMGRIVALEGSFENAKATVEFENFGEKQLLLRFARFTVLK